MLPNIYYLVFVVIKTVANIMVLYLALLGGSSIMGLHVHHSMHQEKAVHADDLKRENRQATIEQVDHCKQHCQSENLLEHAFDNSANIEKTDVNKVVVAKSILNALLLSKVLYFQAIKVSQTEKFYSLLQLKYFLQPLAPPIC